MNYRSDIGVSSFQYIYMIYNMLSGNRVDTNGNSFQCKVETWFPDNKQIMND